MGLRGSRNGTSFLLMLGIGRVEMYMGGEGMFCLEGGLIDVMRWLCVGCCGNIQVSRFNLMIFTINAIRPYLRCLYDNSS